MFPISDVKNTYFVYNSIKVFLLEPVLSRITRGSLIFSWLIAVLMFSCDTRGQTCSVVAVNVGAETVLSCFCTLFQLVHAWSYNVFKSDDVVAK